MKANERLIKRELDKAFDINIPHALIITGVRRSGKSTFMKQLMEKHIKTRYVSFEDVRLSGFEKEDFEKLEEIFNEEDHEERVYLFDEIQNIQGWELYVRQKLDQRKRIIITGSNASLLSRELGTRLTGRHLDFEMFPFSFTEFLAFKGQSPSKERFEEYLTTGGFPEYLQSLKEEILRNLLNDILIRDIAVRYNLRNTRVLRELTVFLLTNLGKPFTFHSLRKTFNLGATSTVIDYISFLEDSYLIFIVPKFDYSLKKQTYYPKKVYAIDNGLANANSLSFSSDKGRLLENLVFINLRRRYKEIFYFNRNYECDFVVREKNQIIKVIQVC
ncbi:MAG: ATP-binding protein [Bacteroidales bacterium]|nr:ATP-binding protein [Bacteroidales bacterium]